MPCLFWLEMASCGSWPNIFLELLNFGWFLPTAVISWVVYQKTKKANRNLNKYKTKKNNGIKLKLKSCVSFNFPIVISTQKRSLCYLHSASCASDAHA